MFVCHQVVKYFDLERCRIKSGIKRALCKARQSPPFMIIAEAEKKNKTTKYEVKHLIDGSHWFWPGIHYFTWGESQGLTNGKLEQNHFISQGIIIIIIIIIIIVIIIFTIVINLI